MTKYCGLSKLFPLLVALFCLTLAAPQSQAQNIKIGPGVQDACFDGNHTEAGDPTPPTADGWCEVTTDGVNVILGDTLNVYMNSVKSAENMISPLVVGFATPVQNLLAPFFGGPANNTNAPDINSVTDGWLLKDGTHLPCWNDTVANPGDNPCAEELAAAGQNVGHGFPGNPVAIDYSSIFNLLPGAEVFPDAFPGGFNQGTIFKTGATGASGVVSYTNTNIYDFIGLPQGGGANSNKVNNWEDKSIEIPAKVLGLTATSDFLNNNGVPDIDELVRPTEGWRIWLYTFDFGHGNFDAKDAIHFLYDELDLPLGTWAFAWAIGEKCKDDVVTVDCTKPEYFSMSMTESALLMPLPEGPPPGVPEPASLLLLGTGLLGIGRQWRKRQQSRKQSENQNIT